MQDQLQGFIVTFGTQYGNTPNKIEHPLGMTGNGYAVIEALNEDHARKIAHGVFGDRWAFLYTEKPQEVFVPDGELLRVKLQFKHNHKCNGVDYSPSGHYRSTNCVCSCGLKYHQRDDKDWVSFEPDPDY